MKNYEELTYGLLKRRERYLAEKRRKQQRFIAITIPVFCFSLVAILSVGIWYASAQQSAPPISMDYPVVEIPVSQPGPEYDALPKTYRDLTGLTLEQWQQNPDVVWKDGSPIKGEPEISISAGPGLGHKMIGDDLSRKFQENPDDTVYAVMVDFSYMDHRNYVYESKTLADWETEKNALLQQGRTEEGKAAAQKVHEAKEAYYFESIERFQDEFAAMGMGIYHEKHGFTHENCIFYTFATREQLEEFTCAADEAFVFSAAVRFK